VTLGTGWPDPAVVYQLVPIGMIEFVAVFAIMTALIAAIVLMARSGRGQAFADLVRPGLLACGAAIAVALPGVAMLPGSSLGAAGSAFAVVLAAVLTWFAGSSAAKRGLAGGGAAGQRDRRGGRDTGPSGSYPRRSDRFDAQREAGRHPAAGYEDDAGYGAPARTGQTSRERDSDIGYPALAALAAERSDLAGERRAGDFGIGEYGSGRNGAGRPDPGRFDSGRFDSGQFDSGQFDSGQFDSGPLDAGGYLAVGPSTRRGHDADGSELQAGLFGQITIYTLLEERIDEFDRMTEQVVEQVRAKEPGTLVYIVHAVPTAPMQRILYEVYRDRPAYDEHLIQHYMTRYTAERRSMVLATNAIELGLQQAKVSPLPSYSAISDILSESGIDLTGVTRSPRGTPTSAGDRHGRPAPRELPAPGAGRYSRLGPDDEPDFDGPDFQGPDYDRLGDRGPDYNGPDGRGPDDDGLDSRGPDDDGLDSRGPDYRGPGYRESGRRESGSRQPGYGEPGYGEPGYGEPGYGEPGYGEPGYEEPGHRQPGYHREPGYEEPGYREPGYEEPGHREPGYDEPGYQGPDYRGPDYRGPDYQGPEYDRRDYHGPERDGWGQVRGEDGYR
jgi:quinol monooxygenase YgiN